VSPALFRERFGKLSLAILVFSAVFFFFPGPRGLFSGVPGAVSSPKAGEAGEAAPGLSETETRELREALDGILRSKVEEGEFVGAVLLVRKDGLPVYGGAAGMADREAGKPMRIDSVFRLASVSKAFTTMAAGVLVSRGLLDPESPVGDFLEAFGEGNPELGDKRALDMKVSHLLSHSAGLKYSFGEEAGEPYRSAGVSNGCESVPGLTLEENIRRIAKAPLSHAPGADHVYSVASDVLGAVVAKVRGKSLPETMDELVLGPLGISDVGYVAKDPGALTAHYRHARPRPKRMSDPERFGLPTGGALVLSPGRALRTDEFPSGGCGMVGSAPSVMKLLEAVRTRGGGIVAPETMESFWKDAVAPARPSPGEGFGAGWGVVLDPAEAGLPVSPGTLRWGGVYGHNWYVDPKNGITVVLLTNTALRGFSGNTKKLVLEEIYERFPADAAASE
jgi:CubicO group peptidase (beta-lactamase class C family)